MKGSIRFFLGLLIVFGSVGGIETEAATLLQGSLLAIIGIAIAYSGASVLSKENQNVFG
jgi:hypothetical protein